MPAMHLRMAVGVKHCAIVQRVWPAIHKSYYVVVVPACFLADRMSAQGALTLLPDEKPQNLFPVTQFVLHPLDSESFPFQLVLRVEGVVSPW